MPFERFPDSGRIKKIRLRDSSVIVDKTSIFRRSSLNFSMETLLEDRVSSKYR